MTTIEARSMGFPRLGLVFCVIALLTSCNGGSGESGDSTPQSAADDAGLTEEEIAAYQEKVSRKVSSRFGGAMANALVEDYGISRDQAECLSADPRIVGLERISHGDPEILALFDECGVDPAVVK